MILEDDFQESRVPASLNNPFEEKIREALSGPAGQSLSQREVISPVLLRLYLHGCHMGFKVPLVSAETELEAGGLTCRLRYSSVCLEQGQGSESKAGSSWWLSW